MAPSNNSAGLTSEACLCTNWTLKNRIVRLLLLLLLLAPHLCSLAWTLLI
jgi:hypothetical protein